MASLPSPGDSTGDRRIPRCHIPWQQMVIDSSGVVNPCCYWSAYGNLNPPCGNLNDRPLLAIWNGQVYRNLRRHMARGDLAAAGCANCLALKQNLGMGLRFDPDADREHPPQTPYAKNLDLLRSEIAAGADTLKAMPTIISLTVSHACNFRCIHCYQDSTRDMRIRREAAIGEVLDLVPVLHQIIPGGGEPFLDRGWRQFLKTVDVSVNPYLELATTTNASLVSAEILSGLERFKRVGINVSCDGGSKQVYERVRVHGQWEKVVGNIDRLIDLTRRKGPPSFVSVTMSVMKANLLDIPNLVRFAMARQMPFGLSPVVSMPVEQSLTCFHHPEEQMRGWKEAIRQGQSLFEELSAPCGGNGSPKRSHTHFEALANCIPWGLFERPHYRAQGTVDRRVLAGCHRRFGPEFLVGFYPDADGDQAECRYYAPLAGDRYEVWLPEGEYTLGFFPRNAYPSRLTGYRIHAARRGDGGRIETIALPSRGEAARRVVCAAAGRVLPRWSKHLLKRMLAMP